MSTLATVVTRPRYQLIFDTLQKGVLLLGVGNQGLPLMGEPPSPDPDAFDQPGLLAYVVTELTTPLKEINPFDDNFFVRTTDNRRFINVDGSTVDNLQQAVATHLLVQARIVGDLLLEVAAPFSYDNLGLYLNFDTPLPDGLDTPGQVLTPAQVTGAELFALQNLVPIEAQPGVIDRRLFIAQVPPL